MKTEPNHKILCEACERATAQVTEPCEDATELYKLCAACHQRLHARALRPVEWYNLAKRHGWQQFLLHDDFYLDDGTATNPENRVEEAADFPAPSLAAVANDVRMLLDYSITRWHFNSDLGAAWASHPGPEILTALSERFGSTSNIQIRSRVLQICASALRNSGAEFVRYAWGDYPTAVDLASLAQASAACLPFSEGFGKVTDALAQLEGAQKRNLMLSMSYFHSPKVLDWIEQNIFEPITESWGCLAAASELDWQRVENWFHRGRPLSLVAIDALGAIVRPQSPLLRAYGPRLHGPPESDRIRQVLSAYADRDRVPRVQQRTAVLISSADVLRRGISRTDRLG